jgi:hypothetical protein
MTTVSTLRKASPVLVVDRIEPVVAFWQKLGLKTKVAVPDQAAGEERLGFVILATEGAEIMYQTAASIRDDLLKSASDKEAFLATPQQTILFVAVDELSAIEIQLRGERQVMPRRTTFYGTTEIGYADPAGNIVIFAEHAE